MLKLFSIGFRGYPGSWRIHPMKLSYLGFLAVGLLSTTMALTPKQSGTQPIAVSGPRCYSVGAQDYIRSSFFSVPSGKIFVLTGIASSIQLDLPAVFRINGVAKMSTRMYDSGLTVEKAPDGIFASAGDQV